MTSGLRVAEEVPVPVKPFKLKERRNFETVDKETNTQGNQTWPSFPRDLAIQRCSTEPSILASVALQFHATQPRARQPVSEPLRVYRAFPPPSLYAVELLPHDVVVS